MRSAIHPQQLEGVRKLFTLMGSNCAHP
jgi:hypothetical protein